MKKSVKRKVGRPSKYSDQLAVKICCEISTGRSVSSVLRDKGMPTKRTFYTWLQNDSEFVHLYDRAKHDSIAALADQILSIADDDSGDFVPREDGNGLRVSAENIQRSRLRIDARKWLLAKMAPTKYGDVVVDTTDGKSPVLIVNLKPRREGEDDDQED